VERPQHRRLHGPAARRCRNGKILGHEVAADPDGPYAHLVGLIEDRVIGSRGTPTVMAEISYQAVKLSCMLKIRLEFVIVVRNFYYFSM